MLVPLFHRDDILLRELSADLRLCLKAVDLMKLDTKLLTAQLFLNG